MLNNFKVAFLFIGAVVGAGFATGREISLFFSGSNFWTLIAAGLMTGLFCCLFLWMGKLTETKNRILNVADKAVGAAVVFSTLITFIAMVAGAETLFYACFHVRYIGLISGLLAAVCSMFSMHSLKNINLFIVPVIIVMTVILFVKAPFVRYDLPFKPFNALNYTAMNMMLGGYLIKKQGKNMSAKNIALTGMLTAILITLMLLFMYYIVMSRPYAEMPVFDFALQTGLAYVCAVIIYLAIFSTMLGSAKIITGALEPYVKTNWMGFLYLALLTVFTFRYNFQRFVDGTYPIVSVVGILFIVYTSAASLFHWFSMLKRQKPALLKS